MFVYGTLKRGEAREQCWPRRPSKVEAATVCGALYDLGPYPALVAGDETITGELWHFHPGDMDVTLAALDRVEGFRGSDDDLYERVVIECQTVTGGVQAWTYLYARARDLTDAQRVLRDAAGLCRWSRPTAPNFEP